MEALFTALCGLVFFSEYPSAFGWIGILASSLGVMLMNLGKEDGPVGLRRALYFDSGALLALGCAVFLVLASFLLKKAIAEFVELNPHLGTSRFEAAVHAVFHTTWMENAGNSRMLPEEIGVGCHLLEQRAFAGVFGHTR